MALTNSQINNGIGYLQIWINQAQNMVAILESPTSTPADITNAQNTIKNCLINIYKLMNTACQALGHTPPTAVFTAIELKNMGIL
jgi:hypothetical protein